MLKSTSLPHKCTSPVVPKGALCLILRKNLSPKDTAREIYAKPAVPPGRHLRMKRAGSQTENRKQKANKTQEKIDMGEKIKTPQK